VGASVFCVCVFGCGLHFLCERVAPVVMVGMLGRLLARNGY